MFKCTLCGHESQNVSVNFCANCGHDVLSKDWLPTEVDQPSKIEKYMSTLSEIYFDSHSDEDIDKYSMRVRARLKISYDVHLKLISELNSQKRQISHLTEFVFEFNENVLDAYAGHDTRLSFRFTNLSDDLVKVCLFWDDPETTDRIEYLVESNIYIKPTEKKILGGTAIFDRIGPKEIIGMQITITDILGESAVFIVSPFTFTVHNSEAKLTQYFSTHNQISIEGRGVVDASAMGNNKITDSVSSREPHWKLLNTKLQLQTVKIANKPFNKSNIKQTKPQYLTDILLNKLSADKVDKINNKAKLLGFDLVKLLNTDDYIDIYNKVITLAEHFCTPEEDDIAITLYSYLLTTSEKAFGFENSNILDLATYLVSLLVNKHDYDQAIPILRKIIEFRDDNNIQNLLGFCLMSEGKFKNIHEAECLLLPAAKNGYSYAISNIGNLYFDNNELHDINKAEYWYKIGAENGDNHDRRKLAIIYFGKEEYDDAFKLLREAAENKDDDARSILKDKGVILMEANKLDHAYKWLERAGKLGDKCVVTVMREQGKLLISDKNYNEAEKWLFRAYTVGDNDPESKELIMYLRDNSLSKYSENCFGGDKANKVNDKKGSNKSGKISSADYGNNIKNIIVKFKPQLNNKAIHIKPCIPEKKISNVIGSYAAGAHSETILMVYDNTIFGSSKDGFAITTDTIYIHNMSEKNSSIKLQEISSVRLKCGKFKYKVHINDNIIISLDVEAANISSSVIEVLEAIISMNNENS